MSPTQATKSYENSISVSFGKCNEIRWKKKKLGVVGATPSRHPNMRLHIGVKMFKKVSKNDTPTKADWLFRRHRSIKTDSYCQVMVAHEMTVGIAYTVRSKKYNTDIIHRGITFVNKTKKEAPPESDASSTSNICLPRPAEM